MDSQTELMQRFVEAAAAAPAPDRLSSLPDEISLTIWMHVTNPVALSRTSKRFQALSKSVLWRAKWFMQTFERYLIIFEALARPRLCTAALIQQLCRLGAPLSRECVQLLHVLRDPSLRRQLLVEANAQRRLKGFGPQEVHWAKNVSFSAYGAVVEHAVQLYGDAISYEPSEFDSYLIFRAAGNERSESNRARAKRIFTEGRFLTLPLRMSFSNERQCFSVVESSYEYISAGSSQVLKSILADPTLATVVVSNGFELSAFRMYYLLDDVDCPTSRLVERGVSFTHKLPVEEFVFDGVVQVQSWIAEAALQGLMSNSTGFEYHGDQLVQRLREPQEKQLYNVLSYLDQRGVLSQDLSTIVGEYLSTFVRGAVTTRMITMLERVERDFPHLDCVRALFVRAMFIKAERVPTEDPDDIKALMKGHKVTASDVLRACMRNGCRTTAPFRFAIKHIADVKLSALVEALILGLLEQPYRGIMLRELDRFFEQSDHSIDFHAMLTAAVERQALSSAQVPAQQWEVERTPEDKFKCNAVAPVRSMLAFCFENGNAGPVNLCKCKSAGFVDPPAAYQGKQPAREFSLCKESDSDMRQGTRWPWLMEATCWSLKMRAGIDECKRDSFDRETFCNVYGSVLEDDEPIGQVIVDLLGPQSYSADIVLSHAVANGNRSLVDWLIRSGVQVKLEHYRIALKVGYTMSFTMSLTVKGPFKTSFHADGSSLASLCRPGIGLNDEHWKRCLELAATTTGQMLIEIDAQQDGSLVFAPLSKRRDRPAFTLEAAPRPSGSSTAEPNSAFWDDPLYEINNLKAWLSHLTALRYVEEQKSTVLKLVSGLKEVQSDASKRLQYLITNVLRFIEVLQDKAASFALVQARCRPLWEALEQESGDAALVDEVRWRAEQSYQGAKKSRNSRRTAFKRSPYSYKSTKQRTKFTETYPFAHLHEPQLDPLPDEDSEDEDFVGVESDLESSDSESEHDSVDFMQSTSGDENSDEDEEDDEPPLKRLRTNSGDAVRAGQSAHDAAAATLRASIANADAIASYDKRIADPTNFEDCCSAEQDSDQEV